MFLLEVMHESWRQPLHIYLHSGVNVGRNVWYEDVSSRGTYYSVSIWNEYQKL